MGREQRVAAGPATVVPAPVTGTLGRPAIDVAVDRPTWTLVVASAATLLTLVVFTTAITTAESTTADVGGGLSGQTWALSAMSVGLASALLVAGALADDLGRRRVLVLGSVALALSSVLAAVAPTMPIFVVARILQGVGGAGVLAASLGVIGHAFPSGQARTHATGMWGAMVGAGIALGPLLAGLGDELSGWRAIHVAEAVAAVALAIVARGLAESRADRRAPVDLPGAATLGIGLASLTGGIVRGREGWTDGATLVLLAVGAGLLAAFLVVEWRRRQPMLDLRLFARPLFVASTAGALFMGLALISLMSVLPTVGQRALGLSAVGTAGVLALWSGTSVVVALLARRLPVRFDGRQRLVAAFLLCAIGEVALARLSVGGSWSRLAPGLVIAGVGSGLGNAALGGLAVGSVPKDRAGMGAGANNTARYVGGAAGVAVIVAIVASGTGATTAAGLMDGWNLAALVSAGLCVAAVLTALACRPAASSRA